jgi:hypothetical protein
MPVVCDQCVPRARAPHARRAASARNVVSLPALHRRPNDNEVHDMSTITAQATRHYTDTTTEMARRASSLEQRQFGGSVWRQSGQMAPNSDRSSQTQFISCTSKPRVLEARRRSLPVTRSDRESSHRRRAEVTHVIHGGRWRSGPMIVKPGAKWPQGNED